MNGKTLQVRFSLAERAIPAYRLKSNAVPGREVVACYRTMAAYRRGTAAVRTYRLRR